MILFKKLDNGNVLVIDSNGTVKCSYTSTKEILRHPTTPNTLVITDDSNPQEDGKGLLVSFDTVDVANCEPPIVATNINELITALSSSFFFKLKAVNPPPVGENEKSITKVIDLSIKTEIEGVNKDNFIFGYVESESELVDNNTVLVIDTGSHIANNGQTIQGIGDLDDLFKDGINNNLCYNSFGNASSTNLIYFGFDLGSPKIMVKANLFLWNVTYGAVDLVYQGSNDLITWVDISDHSSALLTGNQGNETLITNQTAFRYVRPFIFSGTHPNFVTLSEMNVYVENLSYVSIQKNYDISFENGKMYILKEGVGQQEVTVRYKE